MGESSIVLLLGPCWRTKRRAQGLVRSRFVVLLLPLLLAIDQPVLAAAAWPHEFVAGPFQCHADYELPNQAGITIELRRLHSDLQRMLSLSAPRRPIHVYLFDQQSTYRRYVKHFFPDAPRRRALFVRRNGVSMVFVQRLPDLETDLRHECTHALLHAVLPRVPLWLDEGLAEYFEVATKDRAQRNPYLKQVRQQVRRGRIAKLKQLEDLDEDADMSVEHYRDAWSWIHFLFHSTHDVHRELINYLAASSSEKATDRLSERLSRRIPEWERQYRDHFLKRPADS